MQQFATRYRHAFLEWLHQRSSLDARARNPSKAAAQPSTEPAAPTASATADYPTRVFFGDTHLHTALSMDAGAAGAKLLPADAYRFAKGEEVTGASGQKAKLSRPLDFLVVLRSLRPDGVDHGPEGRKARAVGQPAGQTVV